MMTVQEWAAGYVVAHIWFCGDEECACYQPRVEQVSPNREAGYPWMRRETLWEGTFVTTEGTWGGWPDGIDFGALVSELKQAAQEYPVTKWVLE